MMEIYGVRVFVDDIEKAKQFYTLQLGLEAEISQADFILLNTGSTKLIIETTSVEESEKHGGLLGRFTGISLTVDDLKETYTQLVKKGISFSGEPEQQAWGGWLATVVDPAGNEIQLVQH